MRREDLTRVPSRARNLVGVGPADRVFDAMLLGGPVVLALLALVGRTTVTVALVGLYLSAFVGHVIYKGVT